MNHFHVLIAVLVFSFFAGSGLSAAQGSQPFGSKIDKPAPTVAAPKTKTSQDSQVRPAASGQGVRKVDCFDEAAYGRAKKQDKNLAGARLCGADLKKIFLDGADLKGANLSGADLGGARLHNANLQGAVLSRANLGGATLSNANLQGARLDGANLREARDAGRKSQGRGSLEVRSREGEAQRVEPDRRQPGTGHPQKCRGPVGEIHLGEPALRQSRFHDRQG